jgi:hypothetical protein
MVCVTFDHPIFIMLTTLTAKILNAGFTTALNFYMYLYEIQEAFELLRRENCLLLGYFTTLINC